MTVVPQRRSSQRRNRYCSRCPLIEAARDHGINQFVFSSTCATYGIPDELPIREDAPQHPINPYGVSKLVIERVLADFGLAHRLRSITLRYFNAAGADPDGEIGEDHDPETHLIPLILDAVAGRRPYITLMGANYNTQDGTCIRDYVHVTDLADAHVEALEALEGGAESQAFNIGSGQGSSVREVIAAVERITGSPVPVKIGDRRRGDPAALVSDAKRAHRQLGWQPCFTDLESIVRTAWVWHQKNAALTRLKGKPGTVI